MPPSAIVRKVADGGPTTFGQPKTYVEPAENAFVEWTRARMLIAPKWLAETE